MIEIDKAMTKFKRKPEIIEADQFLLEEHHPLLGGTKPVHIPEGVLQHKGCGYRMCDICGGANSDEIIYYIQSSMGTQYLCNRDWVITEKNGEKTACGNKTFQKLSNHDSSFIITGSSAFGIGKGIGLILVLLTSILNHP